MTSVWEMITKGIGAILTGLAVGYAFVRECFVWLMDHAWLLVGGAASLVIGLIVWLRDWIVNGLHWASAITDLLGTVTTPAIASGFVSILEKANYVWPVDETLAAVAVFLGILVIGSTIRFVKGWV